MIRQISQQTLSSKTPVPQHEALGLCSPQAHFWESVFQTFLLLRRRKKKPNHLLLFKSGWKHY